MPVRSVLIVDDNALIRKALCEFFLREGDFDVCGDTENATDAIEKAQLLHPDLIVTDLSMPGIGWAWVFGTLLTSAVKRP